MPLGPGLGAAALPDCEEAGILLHLQGQGYASVCSLSLGRLAAQNKYVDSEERAACPDAACSALEEPFGNSFWTIES